jgi:Transcriptional regulators
MSSKIELVMAAVIAAIRAGTYRPGQKLPSAREMRDEYHVSQMTIRTAIERLRAAGWITTTPGAGAFVADDPPR